MIINKVKTMNNINKLLDHIISERKGHYCHALELDSAYAYECVIEQIVSDYKDDFTQDEIIGFFDSIELYFIADEDSTSEWNDDAEQQLYDFDYKQFIIDCY